MLEGATILVFADDWGVHPSSAQHLLRRFLPGNRVVWFNTVGMRWPRPSLSDVRKIVRKIRHWLGAVPEVTGSGPLVRDVPLLPLSLGIWARRIDASLLRRAVQRELDAAPPGPRIVLTTLPLTADLAGTLPNTAFVYYLVDDYASWPGLGGDVVRSMDEKQASAADRIVAASQTMAELHADRATGPIDYLPHGADIEHFAQARQVRSKDARQAEIVYFGSIDERFDQEMFVKVAKARSYWRFLLVGPSDAAGPEIRGLSHVRRIGTVSYDELPGVLGTCTVAFLPYVQDRLGKHLSPLKAREALAAGLSVVATPVPELASLPRGVQCRATADDLVLALDQAVAGNVDVPPVEDLRGDSWEARAERLSEILREVVRRREPA